MSESSYYRWATALTVVGLLLLGWISLGVGILPSEEIHPDLMYLSVYAVLLVGLIVAGRGGRGMSLTLTAMAIAIITIVVIALVADLQSAPSSSTGKIIGLNGFFVILFLLAAMMYLKADKKKE